MTTTIAAEAGRRRRAPPKLERQSYESDFASYLLERLNAATAIRWPSPRYRADPVAFFREILGVEPWERQVEVIEAVRDHPRVAVSSGHKVSKSHTAGGVALWYYSSFPDARVVMSSTTARQVDQILWRELRMMRARGGQCVACKLQIKAAEEHGRRLELPRPCAHSALIDGEIGDLARTGLKSADFREVVGFTAREAEAVAGISGKNLLYIIDEASGVPQEIFEAIEGNRAGGARIVLFSNPTRTEGEFFDAFHGKAAFYRTIRISSEDTPNVRLGRVVIPGLATREWIDEKREEWGEDSPLYKVRVRGEFATREDGKIFSLHALELAEQRWAETPESGRLYIGIDPAGPSGSGDETVYAIRRGMKLIALHPMRGLSDEGHLVQLLGMINKYRLPRETPVAVLDREGNVGSAVFGLMRAHLDAHPGAFELVAVRASDRAVRQPFVYDRMRDELAANLEAWIRDGGALPEDGKLSGELHVLQWHQSTTGRLKLTPKKEIRKAIGRSPDRYDALSLSCWEPLALREAEALGMSGPGPTMSSGAPARRVREDDPLADLDPYDAQDVWMRR